MSIHIPLPSNGKRLIYDLTRFGIPEVPYLAAQNLPFTASALPDHTHRERMEISLILKGERTYYVDGKDYHLRGNQVFITWPHEIHGSGSYLHGRGLHYWMQAAIPRAGEPFLGLEAERAAPLLKAIWEMPRRQFRADPAMRDLYGRMLLICQTEPAPLSGLELSTLLLQWFLLLTDCAAKEWEDEITPDIAKALELISRVEGAHPSVAELAEAACLSESRFKGKFREQLGVPPGEYLLRRRIELGADMLVKKRKSITEVALDLGFSSAQHFSSTFKRFLGLSPFTWLKKQYDDGLGSLDGGLDEAVRPWVDDGGQLHGYVYKSHSGRHPSEYA